MYDPNHSATRLAHQEICTDIAEGRRICDSLVWSAMHRGFLVVCNWQWRICIKKVVSNVNAEKLYGLHFTNLLWFLVRTSLLGSKIAISLTVGAFKRPLWVKLPGDSLAWMDNLTSQTLFFRCFSTYCFTPKKESMYLFCDVVNILWKFLKTLW